MSVDLELAAPETVYRVLSEDGSELVSDPPDISDDDLVAVMAEMVKARVANGRFFSLQRQGRAGTYAPIEGQEATVVGAAAALDPARDWVLPQYRECVALGRYGPEVLRTYALYQRGHPAGGHFPAPIRVFPIQISLAAQIPHAVGLAWAMQLQGRGRRGLRVLRRRRQLRGRLLRGRQLRRRAGGAGAVPLRQQRLGHLHPAARPDGGDELRRQGGRLRDPRRAGRRQRRPGHDLRGGAPPGSGR